MKFMLLVYTDPTIMGAVPAAQYDTMMKGCIEKADGMRREGSLLDAQQLEDPSTARTIRVRNGKTTAMDGPFAEAKEVLGGFNLIEAESMEEAMRIASEFPWVQTGAIEIRPVRDIGAVAERLGTSWNAATA